MPTLRDLQDYADFIESFVAAVQVARQDGKTAADAAATLSLPGCYKGYDTGS